MRARAFFQGLFGCLIVAFGQPTFSPSLAILASFVGYTLLWKNILTFPLRRQRFWRGGIWYAVISLIQLSWMSAVEYQGIYILFVWIALSIWLGLQFGCLTLLLSHNRPLKWARILAITSIWTLLEWSRFHILCGYSWNLVGLALSNLYSLQMASIFGILGLSFWVIFTNLVGLRAINKRSLSAHFLWLLIALFPYLYGWIHLTYHDRKIVTTQESSLNCALVQTGLLPPEKVLLKGRFHSFISPYDQWERILNMVAKQTEQSLDLIVLPEAAVPFSSVANIYDVEIVKKIFRIMFREIGSEHFPEAVENEKVTNIYWMQTLSNYLGCEMVAGCDHVDQDGLAYNSAFFVRPHNKMMERYDKRVLMPLAEYLPFVCLAPFVEAYGVSAGFTPGKSAHVFRGTIPLSASICYEETFPHKVREGKKLGAQLLVNLTNDGWYPFSRLSSQHFEHARFRSVENGVPLIRACNTGVSAAIDSLGRTLASMTETDKLGHVQSGMLFASVGLYSYFTPYSMWGNAGIVSLCLFFLGVFLGLKCVMRW